MSSKTQTPRERDDALFDSMAEDRKRKKRKLIRTVVISAEEEPEEARQTALSPPTASTWTP